MTELLPPIDPQYVAATVQNIRQSLKLTQPMQPIGEGVLLSIHLQSNRPDNFTQFLDDLEASIDDPNNIEVVVKIDDVDIPMNALLPIEVARRPFKVKYISTPLDGGFFELWRSMNDILKVSDPNAYFLWNMNDEMAVLNKGWDSALRQYIGLFPDHIFRLRTSLFRTRNYCDFWENGFAPETSAITTRRWIEIGGDWNPCLGPDSFQQCVAYYFAWHERFNKHKPLREVPIHIMTFKGEGAFLGLEGKQLWKRMRGATKAWYRLMSHTIQQEASRRAQKLHAHVCAYNNGLDNFEARDDRRRKTILLVDQDSQQVIRRFPYRLSWLRITLTNIIRSPYYLYYAGGGYYASWPFTVSLIRFLALRFDCFEWIYYASKAYSDNKPRLRIVLYKKGKELVHSINRSEERFVSVLSPLGQLLPLSVRQVFARVSEAVPLLRMIKKGFVTLFQYSVVFINKGYPLNVLDSPYTSIASAIEWRRVDKVLSHVIFPERYFSSQYRNAVLRCVLLQEWYQVEAEELSRAIEKNIPCRYFTGMPRRMALPTAKAIRVFRHILIREGALEKMLEIVSEMAPLELLPPLTEPEKKNQQLAAA